MKLTHNDFHEYAEAISLGYCISDLDVMFGIEFQKSTTTLLPLISVTTTIFFGKTRLFEMECESGMMLQEAPKTLGFKAFSR